MTHLTVTAKQAAAIRKLVHENWTPDAAYQHVVRTAQEATAASGSDGAGEKASGAIATPAARPEANAARRGHKYGAKSVTIDGHKFPSLAEGRRYEQLKLMRDNGLIKGLELQPRFKVRINGIHITTYIADFRYVDAGTGETVIEEVKGFRTDVYKLKKKLVKAVLGIDVVEINARDVKELVS